MKKIALFGFLAVISAFAFAADVSLQWDAVNGAESYEIYQSLDTGETWSSVGTSATTTFTATGVVETGLILFRVSARDTNGESIRLWSGAWYDHTRLPLQTPSGAGIE